jgi:hypothetical protein
MKIKDELYEYAKEQYLWEHERKDELNSNVAIPLGIITLQIGSYATLFSKIPLVCYSFTSIGFYILLVIATGLLFLSIYYFAKYQIGFEYGYISTPEEIDKHSIEYRLYLKEIGTENTKIDTKLLEEIKETIYVQYKIHTERNRNNNVNKTYYFRKLKICNIVTTILIVVMLGFYGFSDKKEDPTKVELIGNTKLEVNMAKVPSGSGSDKKPTSQPVPPQRPMGSLITEGLDPSKLVIPEKPGNSIVQKNKK